MSSSLFSSPSLYTVGTAIDSDHKENGRKSFPQMVCDDVRRNILQKAQSRKENRMPTAGTNENVVAAKKKESCAKCRLSLKQMADAEKRMKTMRACMGDMEKEFEETLKKTVARETARAREEAEKEHQREINRLRELHVKELDAINESACSCVIS